MSKILVESSCSSASTHRMTQPSTTLNRRYVRRPANIAVEEAARAAAHRESTPTPQAAPSRLVNLRVHAADLEAARERKLAAERAALEAARASTAESQAPQPTTPPVTLFPAVVELGGDSPAPAAPEAPVDAPAPAEESSNYLPETPTTAPSTPVAPTEPATPSVNTDTTPAPATPPVSPEIDTTELAMNIAADYATASLGASIQEYGNNYDSYAMPEPDPASSNSTTPVSDVSVDAIARAASEAIASIRVATEPSEVCEQVDSLKAFAAKIKANHDTPEMRELGNTIDKFVSIAMKSTKFQEENEKRVAAKVALSPKVTRAAAKVTKSSAKVMAKNAKNTRSSVSSMPSASRTRTAHAMSPMSRRPVAMSSRPIPNATRSSSSQEIKERAIEQALHSVATMNEPRHRQKSSKSTFRARKKSGIKRFAIALTCAAACVGGVLYFVGSNIPDISVQVAAMQTGIQAAYPSYVPRDYKLGDIFSENGKITMIFEGPNASSFTLNEEKSSWDSSALLRNYVEPNWGEDYATTHEQGITIYISNKTSDAAWVNRGVLYQITSNGVLTKKQVRNIVVSL